MHLLWILSASVFIAIASVIQADDTPGFFLKVTKNVPRLGRRSGNGKDSFENFFLKASKSVPRIGRSSYVDVSIPEKGYAPWFDRFSKQSKRDIGGSQADYLKSYKVVHPLDSNAFFDLLARNEIDNLKFVSWKDFDMALEQDEELYAKLITLGREANLHLGETKFVPLSGDNSDNDIVYYRTNRDTAQKEYYE